MRIADLELDLHGLTVEQALPQMDVFIYKAFTSGFHTVCINHGMGSGILRQAVHRELKKSSLVKSFRVGGRGEGGRGITLVDLAER